MRFPSMNSYYLLIHRREPHDPVARQQERGATLSRVGSPAYLDEVP